MTEYGSNGAIRNSYEWKVDPSKFNTATGDANLDNWKIRAMLEFVTSGDILAFGKTDGHSNEVGGWCNSATCTFRRGGIGFVDIASDRHDINDPILLYHTHPLKNGTRVEIGGRVRTFFSGLNHNDANSYISLGVTIPMYIFEQNVIYWYSPDYAGQDPYQRFR